MSMDAITTSRHELVIASAASTVFKFIHNAWKAINTHAERRRAEYVLRGLDSRTLGDIGINRSEIMSVVYTSSRERRRSNGNS
jgi:uncharacterized protein YjiS (DUF1127 family)